MKSRRILLSVFFIFCLCSVSLSKEWRGIVPLKSKKSDVQKLAGEGKEIWPGTVAYKIGNISFSVTYSTGKCDENPASEWDVPTDTVVSILVNPAKPIALSEMSEGLAKFEKLPGDFDLPNTYYYLNETDGMSMEVQTRGNGKELIATSLFYFPTEAERRFKCRHLG